MSKKSDEFEQNIVNMLNKHIGKRIPNCLPQWLIEEGVQPGAKIISVEGIGSKSKNNKTDVIIRLANSTPIKISAKLNNADYFGNWYGHKRFLQEFDMETFQRMTIASTKFANKWAKTAKAPFVGVSICFGKRTGKTAQNFTDVFKPSDVLKIVKGVGNDDSTANCMYISEEVAKDVSKLLSNLLPITLSNIDAITGEFKIAHRPINPLTEGSNRGKNVYTKFKPYKKLDRPQIISDPKKLFSLGEFVTVKPTCLNHNHILNELEKEYNIIIPRK